MKRLRTALVTQNLGAEPGALSGCGTVAAPLAGNLAIQTTAILLLNHTSILLPTLTTLQAYKLPLNAPVGVPFVVYVLTAATGPALIYPPASLTTAFGGRINETAVNAAFSVAAGKSAVFWPQLDTLGINWIAVLSA